MTKTDQTANKESLLEFPCRFPIKAMGRGNGAFEAIVVQIVRAHAELWPGEDEPVRTRPSRNGNFVGVTVVVEATSQAQLDAIYRDLTDSPDVLMAL